MTRRCDRNRNRSKRRSIYCPIHNTYLDSVSRKYRLFADKPEHLQQRGMKRRSALTLIQSCTTIPLINEWLEEFWCQDCQATTWYHVCRDENLQVGGGRYCYRLLPAPAGLWQQVSGVMLPGGNPSVGEFTRRSARDRHYPGTQGVRLIG